MKNPAERTIINLQHILSQKILPRISAKDPLRMLLAQRPLHLPPEIRSKRRPAPALTVDGKCRSKLFLAQYKEEAMHAIRFPYFCYVWEGEIDMRLGIPAARGKSPGVVTHYDIMTLPAPTFLLIPSGVFFPDGSQPHRERTSPLPANSHVFWTHVTPIGAFCHTSSIQNEELRSDNRNIFIPDPQLATLVEILMNELQIAHSNPLPAAQTALLLLFLRIQRGLHSDAVMAQNLVSDNLFNEETAEKSDAAGGNSVILKRACDYINLHIHTSLDIQQIAEHAFVSVSQLNRIFRTELQTTVMKYVLEQRMQHAQSVLANTEISIQEIARFVGYSQPPQFNRVFKQFCRLTPREFRRRHRRF